MLKLEGLTKKFTALSGDFRFGHQMRYVLDNIDLDVDKGQAAGILARPGEGKTTLARIVTGLTLPDSGHIFVSDRRIVPGTPYLSRLIGGLIGGHTGFCYQLTVEENLRYWSALCGLSRTEAGKRVAHLIDIFALANHRNTPVSRLKRGTQRQVSLAVTLVSDPDVLVLDEPFSGLSTSDRVSLLDVLRVTLQPGSKTLLVLTSNEDVIGDLCSKMYILKDGRFTSQGATTELLGERTGFRYTLTTTHVSDIVLYRVLEQVGACFPDAEIKRNDNRALITIRDSDPNTIYSLIDLVRSYDCLLIGVARSRRGFIDKSKRSDVRREGRRLWTY